MPEALAATARPVGAVSYCHEIEEGLKPDVMYCYDLELPASFTPENRDGEIEEFYLWPVERVMETVAETGEFKFNCNLVCIDFFVRPRADRPGIFRLSRHCPRAAPVKSGNAWAAPVL